ncbi:5223_t:CDS:2, partial [Acaulospora morrowiae]
MSKANDNEPTDFVHQIAIELSRALNLLNPNDLLAKTVIQVAKDHKNVGTFIKACQGFGRFKEEFLADLYTTIKKRIKEESIDLNSQKPDPSSIPTNSTVLGEVLTSSNSSVGGLIRPGKLTTSEENRHVFKAPAPRVSILGLDKIAEEKKRKNKKAQEEETRYPTKSINIGLSSDWDDDDSSQQDSNLDDSKLNGSSSNSKSHHRRKIDSDEHRERVEKDMREKDHQKVGGSYKRSGERDVGGRDGRYRYEFSDSNRRSPSVVRDDSRKRSPSVSSRRDDRDNSSRRSPSVTTSRSSSSRRSSSLSSWRDSSTSLSSWRDSDKGSTRISRSEWDSTPTRILPKFSGGGLTSRKDYQPPTPRLASFDYDEMEYAYHQDDNDITEDPDRLFWEEQQRQLDREWYNIEESSSAMDDTHNPFADYSDYVQKKEEELAQKQLKKLSARQEQYNKDNELWETNRMLTSGVVQRREMDLDFEDDSE